MKTDEVFQELGHIYTFALNEKQKDLYVGDLIYMLKQCDIDVKKKFSLSRTKIKRQQMILKRRRKNGCMKKKKKKIHHWQ